MHKFVVLRNMNNMYSNYPEIVLKLQAWFWNCKCKLCTFVAQSQMQIKIWTWSTASKSSLQAEPFFIYEWRLIHMSNYTTFRISNCGEGKETQCFIFQVSICFIFIRLNKKCNILPNPMFWKFEKSNIISGVMKGILHFTANIHYI